MRRLFLKRMYWIVLYKWCGISRRETEGLLFSGCVPWGKTFNRHSIWFLVTTNLAFCIEQAERTSVWPIWKTRRKFWPFFPPLWHQRNYFVIKKRHQLNVLQHVGHVICAICGVYLSIWTILIWLEYHIWVKKKKDILLKNAFQINASTKTLWIASERWTIISGFARYHVLSSK